MRRGQQQELNGLDLRALGAMVEAVGQARHLAKVGFHVSTRWAGKTRSETLVEAFTLGGETVASSHRIAADEPYLLFGGDTAPNPQQLLMAAFNACIMVGYVAGASLRGIELESVEIDTRGELDLRGFLGLRKDVPPGHQKLDYEVRIKGNASPEEFAEIHQAVMATSPNYFNMSRPIRMTGTLQVG